MENNKVIFCFRDDDFCGFTNHQIFDEVYKEYKGKITISVVPNSCSHHKNIYPFTEKEDCFKLLEENKNGIEYLKKGIINNKFEIALHGYNHEYKCIKNKWKTELQYNDFKTINKNIIIGKKYLSDLLNYDIKLFVPPNNVMNKKTTKALIKNNLNSSSTIHSLFDRPFSLKTIYNFIVRWSFWAKYHMHYSGVMHYHHFNELFAHRLPNTFDEFLNLYNFCKKHNFPLVIFTHYWQIYNDSQKKNIFDKIVNFVNTECEFKNITEIIEEYYE